MSSISAPSRQMKSSLRAAAVFLGCLATWSISPVVHASEATVVAVLTVPGQEKQTFTVDGPNVEIYNSGGWICSGMASSTPGKVTATCRYNNQSQAVATVVDCSHEKMQTGTLILMETLSSIASVTLVCKG